MPSNRTALITGATGSIGPILAAHLIQQGYRVHTYSRHQPPANLLPDIVRHFTGDITNAETLIPALEGVDTVFHLAALLHIENPNPALSAEYQRVNVDGTEMIAKQAVAAGVRRFVYFSTVKVYGIHQATPVTEATTPHPKTMYAQTKLQGEETISMIDGLETIILRLSAVYGKHLQGAWRRLIKATHQGWFLPIGSLQNKRSLSYVEDVASAAIFAAQLPQTRGEIFNVVGHEHPTMQEILGAIYGALGKDVPRIRIPSTPVIGAVHMLEKTMSLLGKRSPITAETIQQFVVDEVYSGEKLRLQGFAPQVSLSEGWQKTLQQLRF